MTQGTQKYIYICTHTRWHDEGSVGGCGTHNRKYQTGRKNWHNHTANIVTIKLILTHQYMYTVQYYKVGRLIWSQLHFLNEMIRLWTWLQVEGVLTFYIRKKDRHQPNLHRILGGCILLIPYPTVVVQGIIDKPIVCNTDRLSDPMYAYPSDHSLIFVIRVNPEINKFQKNGIQ